jgi:hypothetical protein
MSQKPTWNKGFIQLGEKYVQWYTDGKFELEGLAKFHSIRDALCEVYNVLVNKKMIIRIEDMNQESKQEVWNDCKPFIESLSTVDRIKFCKCYWALSHLAQKRNV